MWRLSKALDEKQMLASLNKHSNEFEDFRLLFVDGTGFGIVYKSKKRIDELHLTKEELGLRLQAI